MATAMITEQALYRLMTWLSPSFPVGGYSYSHGIEFAVEDGLITDRDGLARWVEAIIVHGAGRNDATMFRAAWEAVADGDPDLIVLGGGVTNGLVELDLVDQVRDRMLARAMSRRHRDVTLVTSNLGDAVGMVGAASLVWQEAES